MKWMPVHGYEDRYEVSDSGCVKSVLSNRLLKPAVSSNGYLTVQLYSGDRFKKPVSRTIHSIVCRAFIGERPEGFHVNHKDGDKKNNNVFNLEYCTPGENICHAIASDLSDVSHLREFGVSRRKLRAADVEEIRRVGMSSARGVRAELSRRFGVDKKTITNILNGNLYK